METIGGQAVIEGVMIRNKNRIATAVRTKDGIIIKEEDFTSLTEKYPILKLPVIRGMIGFFETIKIGINALNYSADLAQSEDGKAQSNERNDYAFYAILVFAFLVSLFIFLFLPILMTTKLFSIEKTALHFNIITGIIRIIFFIAYIYAISLMKDVKRLFMYHGAEHKVVNCYENKEKVTVKNAKKYSTIHKRCGTSFFLVMFIIAIACFSIIDLIVFYIIGHTSIAIRTVTHFLFLPIILGLSYEILKLSATKNNRLTNALTYPGSLIQKISTAEPDDGMIKVAIAALHRIV